MGACVRGGLGLSCPRRRCKVTGFAKRVEWRRWSRDCVRGSGEQLLTNAYYYVACPSGMLMAFIMGWLRPLLTSWCLLPAPDLTRDCLASFDCVLSERACAAWLAQTCTN